MKFSISGSNDYYMLSTEVENIFINEYIPDASGDSVRVYLYGLFLAKYGLELKPSIMAKTLGLTEQEIEGAWEYWASRDVCELDIHEDDYNVTFVNLRDKFYGKGLKAISADAVGKDVESEEEGINEIGDLLSYVENSLARPINGKEAQDITSWIQDLKADPEMIRAAFEYASEMGKLSVNYVAKVVLEWNKKGLRSKKDVAEYLDEISERQGSYRRILNSIGLKRNVTEAEKHMIDSWLDEMHFSMERILDACEKAGFAQSPNLRYINKILENWKNEADEMGRDVNQKSTVNQSVLNGYYEHLRDEAQKKADERRSEVYEKLPEIREIDTNLNSLSSKISRGLLGMSTEEELGEFQKEIKRLEQSRAIILTENNYPLEYTDIIYRCQKCSDTGISEDGQRCTCVKERMGEAELWQQGKL